MHILLGIVVLIIYGGGVWKFMAGFNRTNFSSGKLPLALLWPILLITNRAYRQNFQKALKG
jgi:hypothetical protein